MAMKDTISHAVESAIDTLTGHDAAHTDERDAEGSAETQEHVDVPGGDAIGLLKADHRSVEALFKEILGDKSGSLSGQRKNIEKVLAELTLHAKVEESIFYPAVYGKTKRDTEDRNEVLEAVEEHGSMKDLMKKIKRTTGRDETLRAKVQVLSEIVEHHVKEEESELFSEARRLLGEKKLTDVGEQIAKVKARAQRRSAPKARPARKTAAPARAKRKASR